MATKPVKRILDWASGGTTTDPGASKEAAGWVTSDRPPAQWWNWILSSFGEWLSWAETSIDDLEPLVPISIVRATTGQGNPGTNGTRGQVPTLSLLGAGLGDTGGVLRLTYSPVIQNNAFMSVAIENEGTVGDLTIYPIIESATASYIEICLYDETGTILDLDDVATITVHVIVWG